MPDNKALRPTHLPALRFPHPVRGTARPESWRQIRLSCILCVGITLAMTVLVAACNASPDKMTPLPVETNISDEATLIPSSETRASDPTPLPKPATVTQAPPGNPSTSTERPTGGAQEGDSRLATLPISIPVTSLEMAAYFNRIARPDDIALIPSRQIDLLPRISAGRKRVGFPSWTEAERQLPDLANQIEIISYNPEHWQQTPADERVDLPGTIVQAAQTARATGVLLMVSPDRRFAEEYIIEIASHADLIGLQGQRLQNDPQAFERFIHPLIDIARATNPDIQIFVQVGTTQGTAEQMYAAIETIADAIDGISIWTNGQTFDALQEFISLIRPEG